MCSSPQSCDTIPVKLWNKCNENIGKFSRKWKNRLFPFAHALRYINKFLLLVEMEVHFSNDFVTWDYKTQDWILPFPNLTYVF
jgi:hypothetical protein